MSIRHALVDADGVVVNIVLWDRISEWSPEAGLVVIEAGNAAVDVGWTYSDGMFHGPDAFASIPDPPSAPVNDAAIDALLSGRDT